MFKKKSTMEQVKIENEGTDEKKPFGDFLRNRKTLGFLCFGAALLIAFVCMPAAESFSSRNINVLVANGAIKKGELLTAGNTKVIEMGAKNLPSGTLDKKENALGSYAAIDLLDGDILTASKISAVTPSESPYLNTLADGQLAISVLMNTADVNLAGKLRAGDLIRIYEISDNEAILHNELSCVEVLAVTNDNGTDVTDDTEAEEKNIETVTLAVNDNQAKLLAALGEKRLHAALVYRGSDAQKRADLLGGNVHDKSYANGAE